MEQARKICGEMFDQRGYIHMYEDTDIIVAAYLSHEEKAELLEKIMSEHPKKKRLNNTSNDRGDLHKQALIFDELELEEKRKHIRGNHIRVCAFFIASPKFNIDNLKEVKSDMDARGIQHGIIIYKDSITPCASNTVGTYSDIQIELFREEDLQFNVTKHRLQPKFNLLSRAEGLELKKQYNITPGMLPGLFSTDPIARFYNFTRGDIIRVERRDGPILYRAVR